MAKAMITEYARLAPDANGNPTAFGLEPPITTQVVTYTTATLATALNSSTRFVRIVADAKAHIKITAAGTAATANDPFVAANAPELFGVQGDKSLRISFYDGTS